MDKTYLHTKVSVGLDVKYCLPKDNKCHSISIKKTLSSNRLVGLDDFIVMLTWFDSICGKW